jgi:hypothetical protein
VGLAQDGPGGGAGGVEAGLARPRPLPAPAVGQQRLVQPAVVVAAALVAGAGRAVARHGARAQRQLAARFDLTRFSPGWIGWMERRNLAKWVALSCRSAKHTAASLTHKNGSLCALAKKGHESFWAPGKWARAACPDYTLTVTHAVCFLSF